MSSSTKAKLGSFNHASIPVRDLEEAKRFYSEVLGGEKGVDLAPGFAEVQVGGATIGLSQQKGGWTWIHLLICFLSLKVPVPGRGVDPTFCG